MYYQTPNLDRYVQRVIQYRVYILLTFLVSYVFVMLNYQPKFVASDEVYWLKESSQLHKAHDTYTLSKLQIDIDTFNASTQKELQQIHNMLENNKDIENVLSLFSHKIVQNEQAVNDSSMLGVISIGNLESYELKNFINEYSNPDGHFVENDFRSFSFYIYSKETLKLNTSSIAFSHSFKALNQDTSFENYQFHILISIIIFMLVFKLLFSNFISSIIALLVIVLSTTFTFTLIHLFTGIEEIYITFPFISVSIALVDYLFFYYRWHVSQYKADNNQALIKMLNRNLSPAFWTSFLTTLALGSLLFIDSDIVRVLSLSVIISSFVGYAINLSFLPALLSYFHLKHAHIPFNKLCSLFASSEMHYNKKFLLGFLSSTMILIVLGGYQIYQKNNHFFDIEISDDPLIINIPYEKIDTQFIHSIDTFTKELEKAFPDNLDEIVKSIATIIHRLNDANSQTQVLNTQALEQALFYMDLYGISDEYYDANHIKVMILPDELDKQELIKWLLNYEDLDISFIDKGTLINNAIGDKTLLLSASLFSALLILGLITGWIFRSYSMIFIGFIVNTIPIVWFGLAIKLLHIPLSIELLIATTIVLGLASDASIHFFYKYFRSRYFGRTKKHSLEKMFFYSGIPVIFGSLILIIIFLYLAISPMGSLQNIGLYSASLIVLTLLSDIFILPVILLFLDKHMKFTPNDDTKMPSTFKTSLD